MDVIVFGDRRLFVLAEGDASEVAKIRGPFAMMLAASSIIPTEAQRRLIETAVERGCIEFCCVGPFGEQLHDYTDGLLEDRGELEIVTTWHVEEPLEDTVHYFLHVAGEKALTLIAAISDAPDLARALKEGIAEYERNTEA
jgi:hypothetical protein